MTDRTFALPDLGEGLHDAEIVAWHVSAGDRVVADQPLVTVETDKALVDVPSPRAGHIESVHGSPGDIVAVGQPLVVFAAGAAEDKGTVVGRVEKSEQSVHPSATSAAPRAGESRTAEPHADEPRAAERSAGTSAAPAVRRLAASLGVDIDGVPGTGVDGSITRDDVAAAAAARATGSAPGGSTPGEPLRGVRRAMFANMTRAGREVVPATVTDEADIDRWSGTQDITARLIRAVVAGCRASPSLNAWLDASGETRTLHERIDLGVAVETEDGLFAPVIRDVGARDIGDLRREVEKLKTVVDQRALSRETLGGQTITLSNFGMFGGRFADLVVVPPQVAILGAGRAEQRPVAVAGQLAVHRLLPLSLSFDHRAVTGIEATRFLSAVIADLEQPE